MGTVRVAPKVCLVSAICFNQSVYLLEILEQLASKFGPIELKSDIFDFTHTEYYLKEMGSPLQKMFCSFVNLIEPMSIVDIKLTTNQIEELYSTDGRRDVNIDPGYIEPAKLILATTKNFSHRIYLGKGIYGDVQLYWRGGRFNPNPWTYPDYKEDRTKDFFTRVREYYLQKGEK